MSTLTHTQGSTTLAGYTYAYDGLSRPTSVNSTIEGLSTFTYDATSQLTGADHTSQTDETYGFDANGNRNTSGYTTGSNNQTTAGLGFTYTYDDEGNRLTRTETSSGHVQSYEWDYRNRLVAVEDRNTSGGAIVKQVNYEYDAFNRLVHREYDADGAGSGAATNQYWVYDEGINAILQFDGPAASSLSHRYLWSNQVDELLADEQVTSLGAGGNTLWGLGDHLGSLRDIADLNESTGVTSVTNHRTYNAFGKLTAETNSAVDLLFGFTGKQLDEVTGLQHNLFRWYDSAIGQWMSEDPLSFNAGDENVRRYVGNMVPFVGDPTGLEPPILKNLSANCYANAFTGTRIEFSPFLREWRRHNATVATVPYQPPFLIGTQLNNCYANAFTNRPPYLIDVPEVREMGDWGHWTRNRHNPILTLAEARSQGYVMLPINESIYHMHGENGSGNQKYVSADKIYELVYSRDGTIVLNEQNMGTLNYGTNSATHFVLDVIPYWIWRSGPNDPTPLADRLGGPTFLEKLNNGFQSLFPLPLEW